MLSRALAVLALLALLASSMPAAAQSLDQPGTKAGRIGPRNFLETNLQLAQGEAITWRVAWEPATERAYYDIHSHPTSTEVTEHRTGSASGDTGTFTAPSAGVYSWLIENRFSSQILDATILTQRAGGGDGAAKPAPGPELALLLPALAGLALARRRTR